MPKYLSVKRIEANARAVARAKRTAAQQLSLITNRPGEHKREVNRLKGLIAGAKSVKPARP